MVLTSFDKDAFLKREEEFTRVLKEKEDELEVKNRRIAEQEQELCQLKHDIRNTKPSKTMAELKTQMEILNDQETQMQLMMDDQTAALGLNPSLVPKREMVDQEVQTERVALKRLLKNAKQLLKEKYMNMTFLHNIILLLISGSISYFYLSLILAIRDRN